MELKNAVCRGEDHRGRVERERDKREGMKGNRITNTDKKNGVKSHHHEAALNH